MRGAAPTSDRFGLSQNGPHNRSQRSLQRGKQGKIAPQVAPIGKRLTLVGGLFRLDGEVSGFAGVFCVGFQGYLSRLVVAAQRLATAWSGENAQLAGWSNVHRRFCARRFRAAQGVQRLWPVVMVPAVWVG